jgi:hypothetical protein
MPFLVRSAAKREYHGQLLGVFVCMCAGVGVGVQV